MPDRPSPSATSLQELGPATHSPAPLTLHDKIQRTSESSQETVGLESGAGSMGQILPAVFFTFVCYLSVGIPLAILPMFVHLRLGYGTILAGLVISAQYIATFISRPRAVHMADTLGPKQIAIYGLFACAGSGLGTFAAGFFTKSAYACLALILLGRLMLGVGESMVSIGGILWGVSRAGSQNISKVISWNGVATYTVLALGAPLGIVAEQHGGLSMVGLAVFLPALASIALAMRVPPAPLAAPRPIPFAHIFARVAPYGTALALGGIGFGVLATFISLFCAKFHWSGAALPLSLYGACFIFVRLIFFRFIDRYGGFPVALVSFAVEALGLTPLALAQTRSAAFVAAALIGFGFSL